MPNSFPRPPGLIVFPLLVVMVAATGCGSSAAPLSFDSGVGGPVTGALDNHCTGVDPVVVSQASCHPPADAGTMQDPDAGVEPEAEPHYNAEADDDDCKYHVKFQMTAAKVNQNVTFKVTVTTIADGKPATGADMAIEGHVADNDLQVLPNTDPKTSEAGTTGVYTIAPVKFDQMGRWDLRFHVHEDCADLLEDSPHGHIGFLIDVVP